MPIIKCTSKVT